jgi:hypothetical protein
MNPLIKEKNESLNNSAFKKNDGLNYEKTPIFRVDEKGSPSHKVDAIAYEKDIRAFWLMHEKELWIILIVCSFYFLGAII